MYNFERSAIVPEMSKLEENFESFLSNYFDASYDQKETKKLRDIIREIKRYFKDGSVGGWSSLYCKVTWNDQTLENDADFEIFDILLKIDIQNGADQSKIVNSLCNYGAFETVKVGNSYFLTKLVWTGFGNLFLFSERFTLFLFLWYSLKRLSFYFAIIF